MNHIYRSIWNEALHAWVAVSEQSKGQGKRSSTRRKLLMTGLLLCTSTVWALPTGDQLVAGQTSVSTPNANTMQINQASQQAAINWQGFSIGQNEAVNINQPNAQSVLLNRVVGQDASQIQGQLNANGQVYLVNPNGVIFGKTAQVDVGGLVATTHDISNQDFMTGKNHFTQNGATGTVENHGTINTDNGGVVALIGEKVTNTGNINTPNGTTALAAGKTVDLDFTGNGLIEVKVSEAALNAQISNQGTIQADGGRVVLSAKAAGQLIDTVINQQGIIRAQGLVERNGEIILDGGDNGIVQVSGTLDANNTNQGLNSSSGGNITVKGVDIQLINGAIVTASGNTGGGTITIGDKQSTQQTTIAQGATVTAQTLNSGTAGTIKVFANMDSGTVNVAGNLDASAPNNGDGGFIDTSAALVNIADTAIISTLANNGKTGTWLIDPVDFTISAGVAPLTISGIGASTLSNNLLLNNVSIATDPTTVGNGDIFVNSPVTWAGFNTLKLSAHRDININASISNTGSGNFVAVAADNTLNPAFSGNITLGAGVNINVGGTVTLVANSFPFVSPPFLTPFSGQFINNSGSSTPIIASQWWIYSTNPAQNSLNGMTAPNKHYAQLYTGATPAYASAGNWFLYSIAPVLQVSPNTLTVASGTSISSSSFASNFAGFIDGDIPVTAGITGSASFTPTGVLPSGIYNVAYLTGFSSFLGYTFADNTASVNELTVNPTPVIPPIVIPPVVTPPVLSTVVVPPVITSSAVISPVVAAPVAVVSPVSQIATLQSSTIYLSTYHPSLPVEFASSPSDVSHVDSVLSVDDISENFSSNPFFQFLSRQEDNKKPILPILKVKNSAGRVKRLELSANKQFLSLLMEDGSVRIWDFERGVQRKIVTANKEQALTDISAVDDKGELLSISSKVGIGPHDIISSIIDEKSVIDTSNINHFVTTNDGSLLLINVGANKLSLWDTKQSKERWSLDHERGVINNLALTDDKHYCAVLSRQAGVYAVAKDNKVKPLTDAVDIIDLTTGKTVKALANAGENIVYMRFKDNDTLLVGLANGKLLNWSMAAGSKKSAGEFTETVVAVDNTKEAYAYVAENGTLRIGNDQGKIHLSIQNKENPIKEAKLLEGGKKLLTVLASGDLALWDVESGKKILRLFSTKQGWTVMDAYGRFDGSDEAMENFSWLAGEEEIPLDNFSENYYEPGLLTSVLQNKDYLNSNPDMVADGISLPPKVDLQLIEQQSKADKVAVKLDVYDRGGGIDKVQIYQNGKLISNESTVSDEQSLQENTGEHRVLTLNVTPNAGKNTLKVVASNSMGIENSSSEISFDGKTKAYASSVRLMTVGINDYKEKQLHLNYSVPDAELISKTLKNNSKLIASKTLTNENATKPQILAELKEISQGTQQDVLVIYFAGHGVAAGKEWYFLPYETKLEPSVEQIVKAGITATELSEIFKQSKIQHILLMVDSCHSGAGMNAFSTLENGQRYFSRQLSRSLGITVITAAAKDQEAAELKSLGHGLFTYLMDQELQKKDSSVPITAHGIAESIGKSLPAFSKKTLGIIQEPVIYTKGNDFMLTDLLKDKK